MFQRASSGVVFQYEAHLDACGENSCLSAKDLVNEGASLYGEFDKDGFVMVTT